MLRQTWPASPRLEVASSLACRMLHGCVPLNEPDLNVNVLRSEDVRRACEVPFLLQFHPMQKIVMPDLFVTTDQVNAALLALLAPLLIRNPLNVPSVALKDRDV